MTTQDTDIIELYRTPAHTLEVGDQAIIEGDLCIIRAVEETDDIDEVFVKVENLSDNGETEFSLFADDEFTIWSI